MTDTKDSSWGGERIDVLGVQISAINLNDACTQISNWIDHGDKQYVCVTGVHGVIESTNDSLLRDIHNAAGMVTPDGMPLVWIGRRLGAARMTRVYGPDLMRMISAPGVMPSCRHFYYGGAPGVADRL